MQKSKDFLNICIEDKWIKNIDNTKKMLFWNIAQHAICRMGTPGFISVASITKNRLTKEHKSYNLTSENYVVHSWTSLYSRNVANTVEANIFLKDPTLY